MYINAFHAPQPHEADTDSTDKAIKGREMKSLASAQYWKVVTGSQVALVLKKNLPANAGRHKDPGSILGGEDPLEKEVASHSQYSSPGESHRQRSPGGL